MICRRPGHSRGPAFPPTYDHIPVRVTPVLPAARRRCSRIYGVPAAPRAVGRGDARERAEFSPQAETKRSGLCGDEVSRPPAVRADGCAPARKERRRGAGNPAAPRAVGRGRATERREVSPFGGTERSAVCKDEYGAPRVHEPGAAKIYERYLYNIRARTRECGLGKGLSFLQ